MVVNSLLSCAFLLLLQVPLAACSEWNGLQRYGTYLLRERITFINDTIVVQNDTQYDIHTTHVLSITGLVLADGVKPTIDGGSVPHPVPGNVPNKTGVRLFHVISPGNVTITNVTFQRGYHNMSGGAFLLEGGTAYFVDCIFKENFVELNGAGMFATAGATLTLVRTKFVHNQARQGGGLSIGYNMMFTNQDPCSVFITDSIFSKNFVSHERWNGGYTLEHYGLDSVALFRTRQHYGAGMFVGGGNVVLMRVHFTDNEAGNRPSMGWGAGAGLTAIEGSVKLFFCYFGNNFAAVKSPAIFADSVILLYRPTFSPDKNGEDPSTRLSLKMVKCAGDTCHALIGPYIAGGFPKSGIECTEFEYTRGVMCSECPPGKHLQEGSIFRCLPCEAGKFSNGSGRALCTTCIPGSYQLDKEQTLCKECSAGKYSELPLACFPVAAGFYATECADENKLTGCGLSLPCPPGFACPGLNATKRPCALGTTTATAGSYLCSACVPGKFRSNSSFVDCAECPSGFACSVGSIFPVKCEAGRYSSRGSSECSQCVFGKYSAHQGSHECTECSSGQFQDNEGSVGCKYCPADTFSNDIGNTAIAQCRSCEFAYARFTTTNGTVGNDNETTGCKCKANFYENPTSTKAVDGLINDKCLPCPDGAMCPGAGTTVQALITQQGFWRLSEFSEVFYLCSDEDDGGKGKFCIGGAFLDSQRDSQCEEGHTGILCSQCKDLYSRVAAGSEQCFPCQLGTSALGIPWIFSIIFVVTTLGMVFLFKKASEETDEEEEEGAGVDDDMAETIASSGALLEIGRRMRILLGFLQVNSALSVAFNIPWPKSFISFTHIFDFVNVDFMGLASPISPCNFELQYTQIFYLHMCVLPLLMLCTFIAVHLSRKLITSMENNIDQIKHVAVQVFNTGVFLLYPSICTRTFLLFRCREIGSDEYLIADYSLRCWEGNHLIAMVFAVLVLLIYILGIPAGYMYLLYRSRHQLDNKHVKIRYGSLYLSYEPQFWYWESVEMMKKMMLTGGVMVFPIDDSFQVLAGFFVAFAYFTLVTRLEPYEDIVDDRLQASVSLILLTNLLMGALIDLDDGRKLDPNSVGSLLIVINIVPLVVVMILIYMSFKKVIVAHREKQRKSTTTDSMASLPESVPSRRSIVMAKYLGDAGAVVANPLHGSPAGKKKKKRRSSVSDTLEKFRLDNA